MNCNSRVNILKIQFRTIGKTFFHLLAIYFVFAVFNSQFANAQAKFSASAPKSIPENQNFNLTFSVQNGKGSGLTLPAMNDFQVLGGPSTSTSVQIVNGDMSQSESYTYTLRPKKQGTFKIASASINVNGSVLKSNEVTVQVTAPSSQKQQQSQGNDPFNDPFFNDPFGQQQGGQQQVSIDDIKKQIKDDVFVKVNLSKSSCYKGEILTATYKLYFRQNISNYNLNKSPVFDGFYNQEIELDPKRRPTVENYNGKQYNAVEILKYNLFPQRVGNLSVAPAELNAVAQVNVGGGFFGRLVNVPLTLKTNAVTVSVKDLPEAGKPTDFSGAVGDFSFSTVLSNKEAKTDDAITYTLKISGSGNLKLIDALTVKFPDGFELYDPKVKENISNSVDGMSGTVQYDYLIVPHMPGDYKIAGYTFSYFNPSTAKYSTVTSPEYDLKITGSPSKNMNSGSTNSMNQQDVTLLNEDIRYIKTQTPVFDKKSNSFFGSIGFMALYATPFLLFMGLIAMKRRNESNAADVVGSKRKRALKLAKKRLVVAEKFLSKAERKNFYQEISYAVWGYLCDKFNIDVAELSKENVEEKLIARNAKAETITKLQRLISDCEIALYSPSINDSEMKNNYSIALNLIADLEDEIKN